MHFLVKYTIFIFRISKYFTNYNWPFTC